LHSETKNLTELKKNSKETLFSFMAESKNEYQEGKNKFYWLSLKKLNFDKNELLWKVKNKSKVSININSYV
jgi:hypothetical protein